MTSRTLRSLYLLVAAGAVAAATAGTITAAAGAIVPTFAPDALEPTPPPLTATATPSPSGRLVRWSGQILDDRSGFVFFTTGDGFRIDPRLKTDDPSGGPTALVPETRVYARASFDTGTGRVVELALSRKPLESDATYDQIRKYAVALSTPAPNPDLGGGGHGFSGRAVLVSFTAEVPSRTPLSDDVYLATDASGWSATAIRMDRVDALHYRVSRNFASGTVLRYLYTRGSWRSGERNQSGMVPKPHTLVIQNVDVEPVRDTVYSWGDQDQNAPDLGNSIPTPFNPIPFNAPPTPPPGVPLPKH